MSTIHLTVEFGGGLELLFDNINKHEITYPLPKDATEAVLRDILFYLRDNILTERVELFMQNDSVRPGILVLINDSDWELSGGPEAPIQDGDHLVLISTLHGG